MSLYGSYECIAKLQFKNDKLGRAEQKQTEVAKVHSHLHNFLISVQIKYFFQNFMQGFKNSWVIWRLKNVVARLAAALHHASRHSEQWVSRVQVTTISISRYWFISGSWNVTFVRLLSRGFKIILTKVDTLDTVDTVDIQAPGNTSPPTEELLMPKNFGNLIYDQNL